MEIYLITGVISLIYAVLIYMRISEIASNSRKTKDLTKSFYLFQLKINKEKLTQEEFDYFLLDDVSKAEKENINKVMINRDFERKFKPKD